MFAARKIAMDDRARENGSTQVDPSPFDVEFYSGATALEGLKDEWNALDDAAQGRTTVFQTHAWNTRIAGASGAGSSNGSICIGVVRAGGEPKVILPLIVKEKRGVRVASWLGEPLLQYGDVVAGLGSVSSQAESLSSALYEGLITADICDVLHLRSVRDDALIKPFLQRYGKVAGRCRVAPAIDLNEFASYEDYSKSLNAKSRKSRRRNRRKIAEHGKLAVHIKPPKHFSEPIVQTAIDLKNLWLDRRGETSRVFSDRSMTELFSDLSNELPNTVISSMTCDNEVAAVEIGFLHKNSYFSYLGAVNGDFASFGPGALLLEDTISWAFDQSVTSFDFLAPEDPYKRSWARSDVSVDDYAVALSARGSVYTTAVIEWGLPMARAIWDQLPASVRRSIVKSL